MSDMLIKAKVLVKAVALGSLRGLKSRNPTLS